MADPLCKKLELLVRYDHDPVDMEEFLAKINKHNIINIICESVVFGKKDIFNMLLKKLDMMVDMSEKYATLSDEFAQVAYVLSAMNRITLFKIFHKYATSRNIDIQISKCLVLAIGHGNYMLSKYLIKLGANFDETFRLRDHNAYEWHDFVPHHLLFRSEPNHAICSYCNLPRTIHVDQDDVHIGCILNKPVTDIKGAIDMLRYMVEYGLKPEPGMGMRSQISCDEASEIFKICLNNGSHELRENGNFLGHCKEMYDKYHEVHDDHHSDYVDLYTKERVNVWKKYLIWKKLKSEYILTKPAAATSEK